MEVDQSSWLISDDVSIGISTPQIQDVWKATLSDMSDFIHELFSCEKVSQLSRVPQRSSWWCLDSSI